jgi:DNA-binding response OmpR family regulator
MLRRGSKSGHSKRGGFDSGPTQVLVVNDDEAACELLCRLLVGAGHRVQRAHNGDQALGQLSVGKVDCVVLDLSTGGIGANLKLLDTIRSSMTQSISSVRIVLVAQQTSNRMFSWQAGIDAFLVRPFHANELLTEVAEVLSRPDNERARHRRKELDAASAEGRSGVALPWSE